MIRRTIAAMVIGLLAAGSGWSADNLEHNFTNPADSARPHTFWYWLDGNITREGITADLEAMKRAGIGGVELYNITGYIAGGSIKLLSPEWREMMRHAMREAGRLGLEVDLNNSMVGWSSSGGPWITPELGMQRIVWTDTSVEGGKTFDGPLAQPPSNLNYYRDVAVLAFPTPPLEQKAEPVPTITSNDPKFDPQPILARNWTSVDATFGRVPNRKPAPVMVLTQSVKGQPAFIQFDYGRPFAPRSLHLKFSGNAMSGSLESSEDGQNWRLVTPLKWYFSAPIDMALDTSPARYWRVAFGKSASVVNFTELHLSAGCRLDAWTGKAMYNLCNIERPEFSVYQAPVDGVIRRDQILDLSSKMDAAGRLRWEVPAGHWTVMRFGYTPTGSGGNQLDCDKFNPAALDVHFKNSLQPWFDDPQLNPLVQYVHVDSYERGSQNWTANLPELFAQRKQYDLKWYLPVLAGRVVNGVRESERFLWDFRNTTVGLMHENYFGHLADLCHKAGKQFTCEAYCWNQFNNVTAGGKADIPMTEFWTPSPPEPAVIKRGASPAHLYGHPIVAAESFTASSLPKGSGGNFDNDFWSLKEMADAAFAGGLNRIVFHLFVHQAYTGMAPGLTLASFGTQFNRCNTWWEKMPGFTRYISRIQYLLQQGQFVGDVLYSCGENSPNEMPKISGAITLPPGYDYDVCDPNVIFNRLHVQDGKLVLPDGLAYRVLVLPEEPAMTTAMARRIGELLEAGATIVGPRPAYSPSLTGQPKADQELQELAGKIWGDCDGKNVTRHTVGKGQIFWGKPVSEVLQVCGIKPDMHSPGDQPLVRYTHRRLKEGDLYFLASSSPERQRMDVAFRVADGAPQLFDPITGEVRLLPQFRREEGRTIVPLQFEPKQSCFVIFTQGANSGKSAVGINFPETKPVMELAGPWQVAFDPKWGGPAQITFDKLEDWTKRPESGIKYYSGKAIYRKTFDLPAGTTGEKLYLDLGKIKNVAEVRLNGQSLGIVWCAPWRVELTTAVKPTGNQLEIDVVNLWPNRMIGDEQLPPDAEYSASGWKGLMRYPEWFTKGLPRTSGRFTLSTLHSFTKESPLLESGLLGPVRVMAVQSRF